MSFERKNDSPFAVVDNFMPEAIAKSMRIAIENHLSDPFSHLPKTHMNWDYWFVPDLYTYLRTVPELVLGEELSNLFYITLQEWCKRKLGLRVVTAPTMSLYVHGCHQAQHNDSTHGRFGFVFSLTKNERRTVGGETVIWRDDEYFRTRIHKPLAGRDFYDAIEPAFNRLLVFDDRMPHGVKIVEGGMDPLEGRIVLHGHIYENGPVTFGPIEEVVVSSAADDLMQEYSHTLGESLMCYHGLLTLKFVIVGDGSVTNVRVLVNRVKQLEGDAPPVDKIISEVVAKVERLRFPLRADATEVVLPLGFGNNLGELR